MDSPMPVPSRRWLAAMSLASALTCTVSFVGLTLTTPTSAQSLKIGRVYDVNGTGTLTRQAGGPRPLALTEDVLVDDTIATGGRSYVAIGFAARALAKLGQHSVVTIAEESGKPVLDLHRGGVYYRLPRAGDRHAETRAVLTPNAIARTTGSVSVDVSPVGELGLVTTICIFEGTGSAAAIDGPQVQVPEDHCVTISGASLGVVTPRPLPPGFRPVPKPSGIAVIRPYPSRVSVYAGGRNVED